MADRRIPILCLFTLFSVFALGALAWACSAQPYIEIRPKAGEPGTIVTVDGNGFGSADGVGPGEGDEPVGIRWDSKTGPKLAEMRASSFSVKITVPDVAPGAYTILAYQPKGQGVLANSERQAPASFEVLQKTSRPTTGPGGPPADNNSGNIDQGQRGPSPQQGTQSPVTNPGASGSPDGPAANESAPSSQASRRAGVDDGAALTGRGAQAAATAGGVARPGSNGEGVQISPEPASTLPKLSPAVATTDLWSGFASGRQSPSLMQPPSEQPPGGRGLMLAASLLATGLIATLFAPGVWALRTGRKPASRPL